MAVRIGFIGTGGIATAHLVRLHGLADVEVVGVADITVDRCEAAVARVNGMVSSRTQAGEPPARLMAPKAFTDAAKMISATGPDAVYIAVPPFAHGEPERAVIDAGKHIFVEKPVGLDLKLVRGIEARIKDAGLISGVGYQSRCSDAVAGAKEALAGRTIGLIQGNYFGALPGSPWWRVQARSGGQMIEQATHTADLMRYLAGEVATVYAAAATRLVGDAEGLDIFDVNTVTMKFRDGTVGTLSNSCGLDFQGGPGWFHGVTAFTRGLAVNVWLNQATYWRQGIEEIRTAQLDPMREQDRIFVEAVATGDPSGIRSDYTNGVRSLQVTLAVEESARSGRPVDL